MHDLGRGPSGAAAASRPSQPHSVAPAAVEARNARRSRFRSIASLRWGRPGLSGSVKTRWSSSGPRPVPGTAASAESDLVTWRAEEPLVRRPSVAATGTSGTGRPATSSADRPGFASRVTSAATFRPANCPEFICRSRCGIPRRYAVGSGSPSSAKNCVNSARASCRVSTPASSPAGRRPSRASRTTARPRGP